MEIDYSALLRCLVLKRLPMSLTVKAQPYLTFDSQQHSLNNISLTNAEVAWAELSHVAEKHLQQHRQKLAFATPEYLEGG